MPAITARAAVTKEEVIDTMIPVNDYWINNNTYGDNKWARATYYEGNMVNRAKKTTGIGSTHCRWRT